MDKIDVLIECLNDAMDGEIEFDRDAVDVNRPAEWGAVELRRENEAVWADGKMIDAQYLADIYLSVTGRDSEMLDRVYEALDAVDELFPIVWKMADRVWMPDIERAVWVWNVRIWGPLIWEDGSEDDGDGSGIEDGDGTGDGDGSGDSGDGDSGDGSGE